VETMKTDNQDIGIEIGYKKVAKASGIKLEAGEKDAKIIADKLKTDVEKTLEEKYKGQSPSDELKKAQKKTIAAEHKYDILLGTHTTLKDELKEAQEEHETLQVEVATEKRDNSILSHFPEKMKQDRGDALLITKSVLVTKKVDGKEQHYINDELVADTLGDPASLKDAVLKIVEDKGWVGGKSGKGDKKDDKSTKGKMPDNLSNDAATEYITKQGIEPMSTEGSQMMIELTENYQE
ncbi:MAG: hypothetical protein KAS32_17190, partial [Candidatus Peribacteraceae bacterium]|nr:hypothetical protein [Candidatus Peribacteraceae bacterium]